MVAALAAPATLVCALRIEERAARKAGARTALAGLGAPGPLPEGPLVSFGFAGALAPDLAPGALVTASKVVDTAGAVLWEGEPLAVPGATPAVICAVDAVVDGRAARAALAARSGAVAADMESGALAATGRLVGVVRAVSDAPDEPVGRLASAATQDGGTAWALVARAVLREPVRTVRTALGARRALRALERAARVLAESAA